MNEGTTLLKLCTLSPSTSSLHPPATWVPSGQVTLSLTIPVASIPGHPPNTERAGEGGDGVEALAKGDIRALCLIRPLIFLNKEEAKHLTAVESTLLIGRESLWPACPGMYRRQAKPSPRAATGCEVLTRASLSSERHQNCPEAAPWLKGLGLGAHSCPLRQRGWWKKRKQQEGVLMPAVPKGGSASASEPHFRYLHNGAKGSMGFGEFLCGE